jgi:hypothetical protein
MSENESNKDGAKRTEAEPPDLEAAAIALAVRLTGVDVDGKPWGPPWPPPLSVLRAIVECLKDFARAAVNDARLHGAVPPDQQIEGPWMSFCAFLVETHKTRQALEHALQAEREETAALRESLDIARKARDHAVAELTKARAVIDEMREAKEQESGVT